MIRLTTTLFTTALALTCSSASFAFEMPKLSDDDLTDLQKGEAIISVWKDRDRKHKPTISKGGIDIMVPVETIFAIMLDCDRMSEISSDIRACDVLETAPDGSWDIRKQKFAVSPLLPKITSTFKTVYTRSKNGGHVMEIEKISGDLKVQEGRWDIISLDPNNSRVIYQAAIKPSLPVPAKIIRKQVTIGIPEILRNLRDVAEADYTAEHGNALQTASMPKKNDDM